MCLIVVNIKYFCDFVFEGVVLDEKDIGEGKATSGLEVPDVVGDMVK